MGGPRVLYGASFLLVMVMVVAASVRLKIFISSAIEVPLLLMPTRVKAASMFVEGFILLNAFLMELIGLVEAVLMGFGLAFCDEVI